jgi:hypothetical protein
MNLPKNVPLPRVGALAILFAMIAVVWMAIISPLWSGLARRAEQADRTAELLVKLRDTIAETPRLKAEAAKLGQVQRDRSAVLIAANVNLAGATLQAEVKRIAQANGVELRSIQQLPPAQEQALSRIGVRADLQSDTAQLGKILYDLQAHNPALLVRALSVRGQEQQGNAPPQHPQPLAVQIEITAVTGTPE